MQQWTRSETGTCGGLDRFVLNRQCNRRNVGKGLRTGTQTTALWNASPTKLSSWGTTFRCPLCVSPLHRVEDAALQVSECCGTYVVLRHPRSYHLEVRRSGVLCVSVRPTGSRTRHYKSLNAATYVVQLRRSAQNWMKIRSPYTIKLQPSRILSSSGGEKCHYTTPTPKSPDLNPYDYGLIPKMK
jgi:hypothetical protein